MSQHYPETCIVKGRNGQTRRTEARLEYSPLHLTYRGVGEKVPVTFFCDFHFKKALFLSDWNIARPSVEATSQEEVDAAIRNIAEHLAGGAE